MKEKTNESSASRPCLAIHVTEPGVRTRKGSLSCQIGKHVEFSTASLESYFFAKWEPVAYDALLVAAAVEFGDKTQRRPAYTWQREFELRIPVDDPDRWNDRRVADALHDVLRFLTGDVWRIEFYGRRQPIAQPRQGQLSLPAGVDAVIPFSNGLDSRALAGLMARELGDKLVRIRLGSKLQNREALSPPGKKLLLPCPTTSYPGAVHLLNRLPGPVDSNSLLLALLRRTSPAQIRSSCRKAGKALWVRHWSQWARLMRTTAAIPSSPPAWRIFCMQFSAIAFTSLSRDSGLQRRRR